MRRFLGRSIDSGQSAAEPPSSWSKQNRVSECVERHCGNIRKHIALAPKRSR
jgi:hypothetical protein